MSNIEWWVWSWTWAFFFSNKSVFWNQNQMSHMSIRQNRLESLLGLDLFLKNLYNFWLTAFFLSTTHFARMTYTWPVKILFRLVIIGSWFKWISQSCHNGSAMLLGMISYLSSFCIFPPVPHAVSKRSLYALSQMFYFETLQANTESLFRFQSTSWHFLIVTVLCSLHGKLQSSSSSD